MAFNAQGTKFFLTTSTTPTTAIEIGEVVSFNGPTGSANIIDVTDLSLTAKAFLAGLADEGELSLSCNFKPADSGQTKARECRAARTAASMIMQFSDSATSYGAFQCYVLGYAIQGGVDDKVALNINVKITGAVSWSTR